VLSEAPRVADAKNRKTQLGEVRRKNLVDSNRDIASISETRQVIFDNRISHL